MPKAKPKSKDGVLKGWGEIAEFLGQTPSVAQRWQKEGMPVTREGRSVYACPEELTAWVGTERGQKEPVHIASESEDLLGDLQGGPFVYPQTEEEGVEHIETEDMALRGAIDRCLLSSSQHDVSGLFIDIV